jgi:signal transduction histidine kinase
VQKAEVKVDDQPHGYVEVHYSEIKPELDEDAFLTEERRLIDAIAREISLIIERRQAGEDKRKLEVQLRHADRLATIGQLSAGVAHELNEPLGNILGFAQLSIKSDGLPKETKHDLEKIITASLYAREVIKKLMIFSRQVPQKKSRINLNKVVEESLYFFESRCAKEGIAVVCSLAPDLQHIAADPAQLIQVFVNLVVNALHAMPYGGTLTIRTKSDRSHVSLTIQDTGIGMSEKTKEQIFLPFFTTKDINQGTGLGLAVVHGIVGSHGGKIEVESELNKGTSFTIKLPITTSKQNNKNVKKSI